MYVHVFLYIYTPIFINVYMYTYVAGEKMSADSFAKTHDMQLATSNKTAYIHTYVS